VESPPLPENEPNNESPLTQFSGEQAAEEQEIPSVEDTTEPAVPIPPQSAEDPLNDVVQNSGNAAQASSSNAAQIVDQAVPNPAEANSEKHATKRKYSQEVIDEIGQWSDVDTTLLDSPAPGSLEERDLLLSDEETENDNCYEESNCPLKRARLESTLSDSNGI
jgi:hypothetical protein